MKTAKSPNEGFHPILKVIFDFLDRVIPEPEKKIKRIDPNAPRKSMTYKRRVFKTPAQAE